MNIQLLSESLYHIWKLRLTAALEYPNAYRSDFLPDDTFEDVLYYSRTFRREIESVPFTNEVHKRMHFAFDNIRMAIPYVKLINETGLYTLPIVGSTEDQARRRRDIASWLSSVESKRKYLTLMNKEFRNAFQ